MSEFDMLAAKQYKIDHPGPESDWDTFNEQGHADVEDWARQRYELDRHDKERGTYHSALWPSTMHSHV